MVRSNVGREGDTSLSELTPRLVKFRSRPVIDSTPVTALTNRAVSDCSGLRTTCSRSDQFSSRDPTNHSDDRNANLHHSRQR